MNRQGKGGLALGISLVSGLVGGLLGLVILIAATEAAGEVALAFTPAAYFSLGILGSGVIASLGVGLVDQGLIAGALGLTVATIGTDPVSGVPRFTFGGADLLAGSGRSW